MKKLSLFCIISGICLVFVTSAAAGAWYTATIIGITPRIDSGDVVIQIAPGTGETGFTDNPSRVILRASAMGAKESLAVLLTAASMNKEITVNTNIPPDWDTPYEQVQGLGLAMQ